ncbi:MAG: phosphoserine phosphatase SerB [Burkholderiaceae bacterium]
MNNPLNKLILQGPGAQQAHIQQLVTHIGLPQPQLVAPHAWRCNLPEALTAEALNQLNKLSQSLQLDYALLDADLQLQDFKLLVMDMDSTLITIECIDEIADMQGLKSDVAAITEAAMRGELDFAESLQRRVALLKGLEESALARVFEQRLELTLGAHSMLHAMKQAGLRTVLVSGGFTYFTERLEHELELDVSHANRLEVVDGKLTGRVLGDIVDAQAKKATVLEQCAELDAPSAAAIVIGDGANDLAMMSVAGLSIAFRAKPVVQSKAHVALNYSGLDGVLNLFL